MRASASYPMRGGILADQNGYGRTAITIGLFDSTFAGPLPSVAKDGVANKMATVQFAGGFVQSTRNRSMT